MILKSAYQDKQHKNKMEQKQEIQTKSMLDLIDIKVKVFSGSDGKKVINMVHLFLFEQEGYIIDIQYSGVDNKAFMIVIQYIESTHHMYSEYYYRTDEIKLSIECKKDMQEFTSNIKQFLSNKPKLIYSEFNCSEVDYNALFVSHKREKDEDVREMGCALMSFSDIGEYKNAIVNTIQENVDTLLKMKTVYLDTYTAFLLYYKK